MVKCSGIETYSTANRVRDEPQFGQYKQINSNSLYAIGGVKQLSWKSIGYPVSCMLRSHHAERFLSMELRDVTRQLR